MKRNSSALAQPDDGSLADPSLLDRIAHLRSAGKSEREIARMIQVRPEVITATLRAQRKTLALLMYEKAAQAFADDADTIHHILGNVLKEIQSRPLAEFSNRELMGLAKTMSAFLDPIQRNILFPKPSIKGAESQLAGSITAATMALLVNEAHKAKAEGPAATVRGAQPADAEILPPDQG